MKKYKVLLPILDESLITTLSKKEIPIGIWDYRINWAVWNIIKRKNYEMIGIISNQPGIIRGTISDESFYSKINFIGHCLSDFTKIKVICRYSISNNFKLGINLGSPDFIQSIQEIHLDYSSTSDFLILGENKAINIDYAKEKGIDFMSSEEFVN